MDKKVWRSAFYVRDTPPWPCPECHRGILTVVEGSFQTQETEASKSQDYDSGKFHYLHDSKHLFTGWLRCAVGSCGQMVAVVGTAGWEPDWEPDGTQDWVMWFEPAYMCPALQVFNIPESCPPAVCKELHASFALIWSDRGSAAGRLRAAVERLLTHLHIKEREIRKHRLVRLSLHARLELLKTKKPDVAKNLLGVKWLGNSGVHESDVSLDDLLTAYEITSHALDELILNRHIVVARAARQLTKRHRRIRPTRAGK